MKVCNECIDDLKFEARTDKTGGRSFARYEGTALERAPFERTQNGRPNRNDPTPRSLCRLDRRDGCGGNLIAFFMHRMFVDPIACDRTEGAKPDIEHERTALDPALVEPREQFGREMQRSRRRCDAPRHARENALIAFPIFFRIVMYVRRQRHASDSLDRLLEGRPKNEFDLAPSIFVTGTHDGLAFLAETHPSAFTKTPSRTGESVPTARRTIVTKRPDGMQKQDFRTPSPGEAPEQTRVNDRRFVEHEKIVGAQHAVELAKEAMALLSALRQHE